MAEGLASDPVSRLITGYFFAPILRTRHYSISLYHLDQQHTLKKTTIYYLFQALTKQHKTSDGENIIYSTGLSGLLGNGPSEV